ncbi:transporter substrate-binding domain-containing protein [Tateyamaria omphalii]|uniref:substrate-binding periplasmic protein n=1 Tax=Tateyamaria omphalii TaxID=299262 RepID=UPI001C99CC41|nr:transporter substrate-binding domain-containing protein [Tateyamaria omphalii]MBY5932191.1 transporter substrate-binding domain-containing protein [Tateyamaria omphalii]
MLAVVEDQGIGRYWSIVPARFVFGLLLFALATVPGHVRASAEEVSVWIYHNFPPFIVNIKQERGLSYDLARLLTQKSDGQFRFRAMVLPRQRLNQRLEAGHQGMVMWANPAWFDDATRTRFLWTDPILSDRNVVISPMEVAFEYDGPRSLTGMTMVGVRGHRYQDVDRLIDYDLVKRVDMRSERSLVQFIASGRGRVAIVAQSAAQYFVQELGLRDAVHVSERPHSSYRRYIMVQPQQTELYSFLLEAVPQLSESAEWAKILERYGVVVAVTP